jgi:TPR repeat protein
MAVAAVAALLAPGCGAVGKRDVVARIGAFRAAIESSDEAAVTRMLEADPGLGRMTSGDTSDTASPLHQAVKKGHAGIVARILATSPDLSDRDSWGNTALHEARDPKIIGLLLDKGANLHVQDASGLTPLAAAAQRMDREAVETLLARGAKWSARDREGLSVLHHVHPIGANISAVLCAWGADPAAPDAAGNTPHKALQARAQGQTYDAGNRDWVNANLHLLAPGGPCAALAARKLPPAERAEAASTAVEEALCFASRALGCRNAGVRHEHGTGTPKDPARAAGFYEQACRLDDVTGCSYLGFAYEKGLGRKTDLARARELYVKACDAGDSWGCGALADLYYDGRGVKVDNPKAAALFRKACDGGSAWSCGQLGHATEYGYGVKADAAAAAKLYDGACAKENWYACWRLSELAEAGKGIARDAARAADLKKKACAGGEERACGAPAPAGG